MAYVYKHIRLDTNQPFYIGIGNDIKRAYSKCDRSGFWKNVVNKHGYKVEILHENITYDEAKEKEKEYIKLYGRMNNKTGVLVNFTDGGEGTHGFKMTEEQKKKISDAEKGEKNHNYGKHLSVITRNKLSEINKGEKHPKWGTHHSKETREKISKSVKGEKNGMYGKKHTKETKELYSEQRKGEKNGMYGKKHTDDVKKRIGKLNGKKVALFKSNKLIKEFSSISEASREFNIQRRIIRKYIKNNKIFKDNLYWKFLEK